MSMLFAAILFLSSLIGIGLTVITLPGTWFILGVAVLIEWTRHESTFNKWVLIACAIMALVGEITDLAFSAVGSSRSGGGKSGAWGSILGGLIGAIAGSFILPILGSIAGAVIGAGLGAVVLERGVAQRSWDQAIQVGKGAAVGRAAAMFVKTAIAAAIGICLTIDALVR